MSQDPEMPPVTPPVEGTDFDETLRLAQEEKKKADDAIRMNDAFGVVPGRLPSDEQFTAMKDFQGAIDGHEARVAENAAAMEGLTLENYMQKVLPTGEALHESDKPLDAIQQEQAKEEGDLDYLTNLFGESSSKDHLDAAWKLFDEFVDKKGLSREAERQLRDHFMNINHGVVATAETPSETTPETPVPGDEPSPEGPSDVPQDGAEATPAEGEPKPETSPDVASEIPQPEVNGGPQFFDQDAEGAFDVPKAAEAEGETQESGEPTPEPGSEDELKPEGEGEVGKSEAGPVLFNYEDYETFEDEPLDEEKEKISIFARMKAGGEKFHERFDHFFNGGTEEQNSKRKMVCVGLAVGAVGIMVAVGTGIVIHNADMANMAAQQAGHITEVMHFTPNAIPAMNGAQEALRHAGEQMSAVQQHLAGSGDTIWAHAHSLLEQMGVKPTNGNTLRLTRSILSDNGLSWESARHLANGAKFVVNIPSWIK